MNKSRDEIAVMLNTSGIAECVKRGVKWLDANLPEWLTYINTEELDLSSGSTCVWGQLAQKNLEQWFGAVYGRSYVHDYCDVTTYIATHPEILGNCNDAWEWMALHGFTRMGRHTWGRLTEQWLNVINRRLMAQARAKAKQTQ